MLLFAIGLLGVLTVLLMPSRSNQEKVVAIGCNTSDLTGQITGETLASFEGNEVEVGKLAVADLELDHLVLGATSEDKWIEVDLSEQKLKAWEGDDLFMETLVSTGLPWSPTPIGEFRIWIKLRATKMEGGQGKNYYYLPNVPYVMFFENSEIPGRRGYGLHGTYWHDDFGTPRSHGCVNLPTEKAGLLYEWSSPSFTKSRNVVKSDTTNPGTKIIIHE